MKNLILFCTCFLISVTCFAQYSENFNDGDFVGWTGNDTNFVVDGLFQLQLSGDCAAGGTNYLSTPVSTYDTATWEFFVDLNFDPSGSNFTKFYLQSDNADLSASLNGYYIRIGEDGSDDAVKLYRQEALTSTLILTGTLAEVAVSPTVRVKVVRTTENEWQLNVDPTGGFVYVNEGSVFDDVVLGGNYIGWYCKYTSTRCDDFFLDDISVAPLYTDIDAPIITSLTVENSTQLTVYFNENLELTSSQLESNYTVDGGVGNPIDATRGPSDFNKVLLTFLDDFPEGVLLTLTVHNVADELGNAITTESASFSIYTVNQYDVVINEFLADFDPQIGLPYAEYIELYNTTDVDIELEGFSLHDATSETDPFPAYNLAAGAYVIIGDLDLADQFTAYTNTLLIADFPTLNNDGDDIQIFDPAGNSIHRVTYTQDWYDNAIKQTGGWSLEMIDPSNPCQGDVNWTASNDLSGGTPGAINSVFGSNADDVAPSIISAYPKSNDTILVFFDEALDFNSVAVSDFIISSGIGNPIGLILDDNTPELVGIILSTPLLEAISYILTVTNVSDCSGNVIGAFNQVVLGIPEPVEAGDVVINEILFNPLSGGFDYLELYNLSDKIIDLSKIIIGELDIIDTTNVTEFEYVSSTGKLLFPGTYVCVTQNTANVLSNYFTIDTGNFVQSSGLPGFPDKEGIVVLYDATLNVIDQLHYYDTWQYAILKSDDGVALERVNYSFTTQDENNWHSAAEDVHFGTPGYQNSVFGKITGGGDIVLEYPIFSPDGDGYHDLLLISYTTASDGYSGMFKIFDASGRLVKELTGLTTLSREGFLTWDGADADGIASKSGIYILYAELFNAQGSTEKHKVKFTLVRK